jgi:hypothetical protein
MYLLYVFFVLVRTLLTSIHAVFYKTVAAVTANNQSRVPRILLAGALHSSFQ